MTYHQEIERAFQSFRGTQNFMLSTEDWGLLSRWQLNGIPIVCVLRGMDSAFKAHAARRKRDELINSVSYCSRWVLSEWHKTRGRQ